MLLHELLTVDCFRNTILRRRIMQDGLIYDKLAIAHARYFLQEVYRIKLQVVACLFLYWSISIIVLLIELFVDSCNFDLDDVFDINSIAQLFIIYLTALFVLAEKSFTANGRLVLILMGFFNAADLWDPRWWSFVTIHINYFKISISTSNNIFKNY